MEIIQGVPTQKNKIENVCPYCGTRYWMDKSCLYRKKQKYKPCCSGSCSRKLAFSIVGHGPHLGRTFRKVTDGLCVEEEEQYIIILYLGGHSLNEISEKLNHSAQTVLNILNSYGIKIRDISMCRRKYKFNENYFNHLDSEEKLYWVGFISADGSVHKINDIQKNLTIQLSSIDIKHLRKFYKSIECDKSVNKKRRTLKCGRKLDFCSAYIRSKHIYDDLVRYGITERKSLTIKPIDENFIKNVSISHYWRGLVDGDGWVCTSKRGIPVTGLCGSYWIVSEYKNFVKNITGFDYKVRKTGKIYAVSVAGVNAILILDKLYSNSNIYLDRKYKKYKEIKKLKYYGTK